MGKITSFVNRSGDLLSHLPLCGRDLNLLIMQFLFSSFSFADPEELNKRVALHAEFHKLKGLFELIHLHYRKNLEHGPSLPTPKEILLQAGTWKRKGIVPCGLAFQRRHRKPLEHISNGNYFLLDPAFKLTFFGALS